MTSDRRTTDPVDVVVVGAGISGLLAATELQTAGRSVVVVDKGRGVGGRLATRRIGPARVDHGAQFFTVRTERFDRLVQRLVADDVVHVWTHGFDGEPDGHPRYAAGGGMTAIAKHLAGPLTVVLDCQVEHVDADGEVVAADGRRWQADHVVVTSPVPQSIALVGDAAPAALGEVVYSPTLCVLGLLDRPGALGETGARQRPDGTIFEFVADNAVRGTSSVPALSAHLTGHASADRWDLDDDRILVETLDAVAPLLGGVAVTEAQLKRWRYATPTTLHPHPQLTEGRLTFAGDAFGEPRVEGAATSGWAAADAVLGR